MRAAAISLVIVCVVCVCGEGAVINVAMDGTGDYTTIQAGIDAAADGDIIVVQPGTYGPINFGGMGVTVTSTDPDNDAVVLRTTIGAASGYSVTFEFGEGISSVLSGFRITGKPVFCNGASPKISNNIITTCQPEGRHLQEGGAIRGVNNARPTIVFNKIVNNQVKDSSGSITSPSRAQGGAIANCHGTISHNVIAGNRAYANGYHADAYAYGGALYECNGTITNNTIVGNFAYASDEGSGSTSEKGAGGALYNCRGIIRNNIIAWNKAGEFNWGGEEGEGGAIYGGAGSTYNVYWENYPNTFGGNASGGMGDVGKDPVISCPGEWDDKGTGWMSDDVWVVGDDYHVRSAGGRWDPISSIWVLDEQTSPCVDGGDPASEIGVEPNPNGGRINIGVYGGTAEASKAVGGIAVPVCASRPSMDFNGDCKVSLVDFAQFSGEWLTCGLDMQEACW